jgi:hypothetical protein
MNKVKKGMKFLYAYADSQSEWEVIDYLGKGSWLCRIGRDNLDYSGIEKAFLDRDILGSLNLSRVFANIIDKSKKFLMEQKPGTVIHYHNGFEQYVRQVVVEHEGVNKLKPVALVGKWDKRDLPSRKPNGEIHYPYHAKQILDGVLSENLNYSTTYEHPEFNRKNGINPHLSEPINLELPEITGDLLVATKLWKIVEEAQSILEEAQSLLHPKERSDVTDPAILIKRLRNVFDLISPLFGERED